MESAIDSGEALLPRRWVYAGRRLGKGKLYHAWINHHGEFGYFLKGSVHAIGRAYDVQCSEDASTAITTDVAYRHDDAELHPDTDEWKAEDRRASTELEKQRAEKRAIKDNGDIGTLTLDEVRVKMASLMPSQRAGMLAVVLEYLR